ncbi:MAG TPA: MBL fold metallo-hydrolase [Candidatus Cloacimonas sp.]|jgi:7,8-dihydropterin-6-yl-methyl-4-(beta-D-ribofuranosyl)aminobenzene 5'-phosphate synthase|nr:MBL fold metallo-hydrolase [Candidatus Cloacimonas sp.]
MQITITYDNTSTNSAYIADWGFSCYIETEEHKIIFDTGQNGEILRKNMRKLKINPKLADILFISHNDFDHIGGLSWLLNQNKTASLYIPQNLHGIKNHKNLHFIESPQKIAAEIYSTGIVAGDGKWEQAVVLKTTQGAVILVGCSHPGLKPFLDFAQTIAPLYAIIGGFHGFSNYQMLENFQLICPTHCTQNRSEIKKQYPHTTIDGGVGKVLVI